MGEQKAAVPHLERGKTLYSRERHAGQAFIYGGHDAGACARWHLAFNRWVLGWPEQALGHMRDAMRLAEELDHPQTLAIALSYAAWLHFQRGEHRAAAGIVEELIALSEANGFEPHLGYARVMRQACATTQLDVQVLHELCNRELAARALSQWRRAFCICALAERGTASGHPEEARAAIASLAQPDRNAYYAAEILRVEGEIALRSRPRDAALAQGRFRSALELARSRQEKSLELRAATSLSRLWRDQSRRSEARALLAPVYGWFTEGFDTADLRAAKALLEELA
jgi:predicted ATPase